LYLVSLWVGVLVDCVDRYWEHVSLEILGQITLPYAENKVEHKMNLVRVGYKEKKNYFSAKRY
jgi:hypothetical protein